MSPRDPTCPTTNLPACRPEDITADSRRMYIDKGINITTLISLAVALASFFVWGLAQERRVAQLEEAGKRNDAALAEMREQQRQDIRAMQDKLDRIYALLVERKR